jgi:glycosyltransferase involved in cell wall biosynthesis
MSLHWGFIPGGIAQYASSIEGIRIHSPSIMKSVCITIPDWQMDQRLLAQMDMEIISIKSRLDFSWIRKTRDIIRQYHPDLLFVYAFNGGFVAATTLGALRIPVVGSWHGDYYPSTLSERIRAPLIHLIERTIYRFVLREIIAVSHFSQQTLVSKGIPAERISVIHNGIRTLADPPPNGTDIRKQLAIDDNTLLVGTCCRLTKAKGLHWLLHTIALIKEKASSMRFVVWGDGPLRRDLAKLAARLRIDDVLLFPGYAQDVPACLAALDLYVMSSSSENFSISLLEAMRSGLPIVATDVGGNREAVQDGRDAILIPFGDSQAMGSAILRLANNEELRDFLAHNASQRFHEQFTADIMVRKTAKWFITCAERYSR